MVFQFLRDQMMPVTRHRGPLISSSQPSGYCNVKRFVSLSRYTMLGSSIYILDLLNGEIGPNDRLDR